MRKVVSWKVPLFFRTRKPHNRAVTDYDLKQLRSFRSGLVHWEQEAERQIFKQIAEAGIAASNQRHSLAEVLLAEVLDLAVEGQPIIIGIDGSPGTGKSRFTRKLANYLNLWAQQDLGVRCFAQVFQMDELLTGQQKRLLIGQNSFQPETDYQDPAFWYNLDRLPKILRALTDLPALQEITIDGLYNRNRFDGKQPFFFPPIKNTFLLLEGCYSLHQNHSDLLDFGVYLWQQGWSYTSFFLRSLMRGLNEAQDPDAPSASDIYEIIIQAYINYLKSFLALEKTTWLLSIEGIVRREAKLTLEELGEEPKATLFQEEVVKDLDALRENISRGTIA